MSKSNKCKSFVKWCTRCEKSSREKGMVGWLIKKGIARSKFTANIELLLVAVLFFWLSPIVFTVL